MHDDQLVSDAELVRIILRDQQPQWAHGPITEISSTGTDHALYRLGDDAVARVWSDTASRWTCPESRRSRAGGDAITGR